MSLKYEPSSEQTQADIPSVYPQGVGYRPPGVDMRLLEMVRGVEAVGFGLGCSFWDIGLRLVCRDWKLRGLVLGGVRAEARGCSLRHRGTLRVEG